MKKIIKSITLLAFLSLFATGCSDFLSHEPTNAVSDEEVDNPASAEPLFNGAWAYLMETFYTYANPGYRAILSQDDMMGNDIISRPAYGFNTSYQFTDVSDKSVGRTSFFWSLMYKVIQNCNQIIALKPPVSEKEEAAFYQAQGKALALRAFCYLHLVQHYQFTYLKDKSAQVVPLYTKPTTSSTKPQSRATVSDVYALILSDLSQAEGYLEGYKRSAKYNPNVNVVNGLLARTYLVMGEWDHAATAATKARSGYDLMSSSTEYASGFNSVENKEWIWGHPQTVEQSNASYNFYYLDPVYPGGYNSFMSDPHFKELFSEGDIRLGLFEWVRDGYLGYKKFRMRADDTGDIVLMRSSEMYLIEAEGFARQNLLPQAAIALNALRKARGLDDYPMIGKSQQTVIDEILLERRRELWGEGFALTDILRTQQSVIRLPLTAAESAARVNCWQEDGSYKEYAPRGQWVTNLPTLTPSVPNPFVPNSTYYLYAIPQTEENANPNLYN